MLSKFALLLSLICLVFLGAALISCGSSSSSPGGCTATMGPVYNVSGDWSLSVTGSAGNYSGNPGVISTAGLAVFFEPFGETGVGDTAVLPTITGGSNCFSGSINSYATAFNGGGSVTDTATGTIMSSTSITGSFQGSTASGTFALTAASPLTGSVTALSGSGWLGEIEGASTPDILLITLTPSGTGAGMTLQGADGSATCTVSGTFTQEGGDASTLNVFDVSVTYTGSSCAASGTQTGLAFESSSDYFGMNGNAAGTYLYAVPSSSASVLEIFKQGAK